MTIKMHLYSVSLVLSWAASLLLLSFRNSKTYSTKYQHRPTTSPCYDSLGGTVETCPPTHPTHVTGGRRVTAPRVVGGRLSPSLSGRLPVALLLARRLRVDPGIGFVHKWGPHGWAVSPGGANKSELVQPLEQWTAPKWNTAVGNLACYCRKSTSTNSWIMECWIQIKYDLYIYIYINIMTNDD